MAKGGATLAAEAESLDDLYGHCESPARVGEFERNRQATWLLLDKAGAAQLEKYLSSYPTESYLSNYLIDNFTMLWVVDANGNIRVALEEVVIEEEPLISVPMPRQTPRRLPRLGHPALVEGQAARIGGELSVNPEDRQFYISNKSGRYGLSRSEENLSKAAQLFRDLGISVSTQYQSIGGLQ